VDACATNRRRSPVYWFSAAILGAALVAVWVGIVDSVTTILFPAAWLASMIHIAGVGLIVWRQPERANATMVRSLLMGMATLLVSLGLMSESAHLGGYFATVLTVSMLGVCALAITLQVAANRSR